MKDKISIIVGGSGQFGVYLSQFLLKKRHRVIITSRNIQRAKKKIPFKHRNLILDKLDVLNKKQIKDFIYKYNPNVIFYFASQSSPTLSFKNKKKNI